MKRESKVMNEVCTFFDVDYRESRLLRDPYKEMSAMFIIGSKKYNQIPKDATTDVSMRTEKGVYTYRVISALVDGDNIFSIYWYKDDKSAIVVTTEMTLEYRKKYEKILMAHTFEATPYNDRMLKRHQGLAVGFMMCINKGIFIDPASLRYPELGMKQRQ